MTHTAFPGSRRPRQVGKAVVVAAAMLVGATGWTTSFTQASPGYDWTQFNGNPPHNGDNTLESTLNRDNVHGLRRLFSAPLPDSGDGAPAYLRSVNTKVGRRDLLLVGTKGGYVFAFDAHTGKRIWHNRFADKRCFINRKTLPCYDTSSPAVDPNRHYVYVYGVDGRVHKLSVVDGHEIKGAGWPELATRKNFDEKGSSALSIATDRAGNSYLYVTNGGYPIENELGDYQGHLTAINLKTGKQHVFNTLCSDRMDVHFKEIPAKPDCAQTQSAVWARAGAVYDPVTDKIYIATGNGPFDPAHHDWADSVLVLHPDGTGDSGAPLDSYTPSTYPSLQSTDSDLGSTAPVILPSSLHSRYPNLALQGGKDGFVRLLNLDELSGQSGPGHTGGELQTVPAPRQKPVFSAPAAWTDPTDGSTWVFVTTASGIGGFQVVVDSTGMPSLLMQWNHGPGGASPLIANGVLYYAHRQLLQALDPTTGAVLWRNTEIGGIHWQSPMIANGVMYILDNSRRVTAFGLANQR